MTTFDLAEVGKFVADLEARMEECDNGEGMECATLEAILRHYANLCCEYRDNVRRWGRGVFSGKVAFDPQVEQIWKMEGRKLFDRALQISVYGQKAQVPCYILDEQSALQSAVWGLHRLLFPWIAPKLAVSPSARQGLGADPEAIQDAREIVASLPALPADWRPDHQIQRRLCCCGPLS